MLTEQTVLRAACDDCWINKSMQLFRCSSVSLYSANYPATIYIKSILMSSRSNSRRAHVVVVRLWAGVFWLATLLHTTNTNWYTQIRSVQTWIEDTTDRFDYRQRCSGIFGVKYKTRAQLPINIICLTNNCRGNVPFTVYNYKINARVSYYKRRAFIL